MEDRVAEHVDECVADRVWPNLVGMLTMCGKFMANRLSKRVVDR